MFYSERAEFFSEAKLKITKFGNYIVEVWMKIIVLHFANNSDWIILWIERVTFFVKLIVFKYNLPKHEAAVWCYRSAGFGSCLVDYDEARIVLSVWMVRKTKLPLTQTSSPFKPIHTFVYTSWSCIKKDRIEITSCKRSGRMVKHRTGGRGREEKWRRDTKTNMDGPCPFMHNFTPF